MKKDKHSSSKQKSKTTKKNEKILPNQNLFFFPAPFLPTLISTFAKSQRKFQRLFCKRADFFHRFLVWL